MQELEPRIAAAQLGKQPPDAEVAVALVGVVEQHDRTIRKLGLPARKIVGDGGVVVAAVDVQQVDRASPASCRRAASNVQRSSSENAV